MTGALRDLTPAWIEDCRSGMQFNFTVCEPLSRRVIILKPESTAMLALCNPIVLAMITHVKRLSRNAISVYEKESRWLLEDNFFFLYETYSSIGKILKNN